MSTFRIITYTVTFKGLGWGDMVRNLGVVRIKMSGKNVINPFKYFCAATLMK